MTSSSYDISLIEKYLTGGLDTRSMHRLELKAQDDPFLMDALDGYQILGGQQVNIDELTHKLRNRIQGSKRKIFLVWPLIIAVIAVLAFAVIGAWWIMIYLPQLKKSHPVSKPLYRSIGIHPTYTNPASQNKNTLASIAAAVTDTVPKDSVIKKKDVPDKQAALSPSQIKHDPTKGTVEASTIIADLNKQPYIIARHKTGGTNAMPTAVNTANVKTAVTKPAENNKTNAEPTDKSGINVNKLDKPVISTAKNNTVIQQNKVTTDQTAKNAATVLANKNNSLPATSNNISNVVTNKPAVALPANSNTTLLQKKDGIVTRDEIKPLASKPKSSFGTARIDAPILKSSELVTITGQVVAFDSGKPIEGAALRITGTQTGTVTDADGRFNIRMLKTQALQANFVGYYGKQVNPAGADIKIIMQPLNYAQNEVVVAGADKKKEKINITDDKPVANPNVTDTKATNLNTLDVKTANSTNPVTTNTAIPKVNLNPIMHVYGRVLAFATNRPIPSIVMWNKTANEQYRLQNDGVFDIVVHKGDEIYAGHTGFKTQKVKIKNNTHFDIVLEENNSTLFDGFVKGLTFTPYDDAAHPLAGWNKFKQFQNIRSTDGKTGTVKVEFTINADNSVSNIKVTKSVSTLADSAAIKIIRDKTKWMHNTNNQPENVSVKFKLQ